MLNKYLLRFVGRIVLRYRISTHITPERGGVLVTFDDKGEDHISGSMMGVHHIDLSETLSFSLLRAQDWGIDFSAITCLLLR